MSWIATAVIGGAVIGALGSTSAASTQAGAQQQAAATQQGMFNTINAQEQPFIQAGYGATSALNQLLGLPPTTAGAPKFGAPTTGATPATGLPAGYLTQTFNPTQQDLQNYPGFQFALQTGGQAVRNADTPGVGALSGAALKDLMNFNVGTANQYYGQYFNQFQQQQQNIFSRLSGLAGLGQNAATNVGTQGTALGTGIAQSQAAAGGAQAGGIVGATNALAGSAIPLGYLMSGTGTTQLGGGAAIPTSELGNYTSALLSGAGGS